MAKRYYFIDTEIYYQNVKQPPRKVEVFHVEERGYGYSVIDKYGNFYNLDKDQLIVEED